MAKIATDSAAPSPEKKSQSNRGGYRPGAGCKPKSRKEDAGSLIPPGIKDGIKPRSAGSRAATIVLETRPLPEGLSATAYALALIEQQMRSPERDIEVRLRCARDILDRHQGRPRVADAPAGVEEEAEQVHIFMPDNGRDTKGG